MALGRTMRGLVALMVLVTTIAPTFAAHGGCRGLDGDDEIAALSLSPGLVSQRVLNEATLTWEFPDDVCLYRWLITLTPLGGGSSKSVSFYEESDARRANLPMNDLQPGVLYRVNIAMEFAKDRFGPEKSIDRVPVTLCDAKGVPGVPVELSVTSQTPQGYTIANDYMEVCWSTKSENLTGCPDEYTVAFRVQPSSPSDLFDERYAWRFEKFPVAGCHRLYDIEKGAVYDIGIRAFNAESKSSSEVALIREYAADSWQCVKGDFYSNRGDQVTYEWCDAAKNGQCTPMRCDEIASANMCSHPSVRRYDPETLTVIQYCSSRCGCDVPSDDEIRTIPDIQPDGNQWSCCRDS